jgi:hypothetical protein
MMIAEDAPARAAQAAAIGWKRIRYASGARGSGGLQRIKCEGCSKNYIEAKGDLCPGCDAYREHQR